MPSSIWRVTMALLKPVFSQNSAIEYVARVNGSIRSSRGRRGLGSINRQALMFVTAIFFAVVVLDADFHAMPWLDFVGISPVVPIPVRIIVVSISPIAVTSAIHVAIAACLSVAMHSTVGAHFTVIAAHTVAVATAHHPFMPHGSIIVFRSITVGLLIPLLLRILIRLCGNGLWGSRGLWFTLVLSE
jgi:hypothetical protein